MRSVLLLCGVLLLAAWPSRAAVSVSTSTLTLGYVLEQARKNNPELLAAYRRWDAAKARIVQDATPDKPRLDFERMYSPRDESPITGAEERNVAISQEIPFPTTLYLRHRKAKEQAVQAEAAYHGKEWDIYSRVLRAWAMLYMARHSIHIYQENADLMRQMARVAESRYAAGKTMQSDVLKAQTELTRMLNMLVTMEQEEETAEAMLNSLLDRPVHSPLGVPEEPEPRPLQQSADELQAIAMEKRPELQAGRAEVSVAQSSLALARSDYLPDFMVGYRRRDMRNGMDSHDAMLGISLPLWFWKSNAMVREMNAEREMAQAEYQAMRNMAMYDVKNLAVRVQTTQRLFDLYHTSVLPQAEQSLKITQAGYQSGRTTFLDLLDAARTLLNFRLEHYMHVADYIQYRVELERAIGERLKG